MKQEAWVKDKVDEEIAKRGKVEETDETKQNAEYTPPTNNCIHIIKNKIPNKFAKVSLEGTGLRRSTWNSRKLETPPSPPPTTSRTKLTRCLQGTSPRSSPCRSRTLTTTTLNTRIIIIKNKHATKFVVTSKFKKIATKVFIVRAVTEEIDVEKQKAGNADTHHPPEHLQEQMNQSVHCTDQRAPADSQ